MGKARIPPLPLNIVLTDRDDATLWLLSHTTSDGVDYIMLTDTIPTTKDVFTYGPYDGPYLTHEHNEQEVLRLFVRGQRLGFERVDDGIPWLAAQGQPRLWTRNGLSTTHREIIVPSTYVRFSDVQIDDVPVTNSDVLGWETDPT